MIKQTTIAFVSLDLQSNKYRLLHNQTTHKMMSELNDHCQCIFWFKPQTLKNLIEFVISYYSNQFMMSINIDNLYLNHLFTPTYDPNQPPMFKFPLQLFHLFQTHDLMILGTHQQLSVRLLMKIFISGAYLYFEMNLQQLHSFTR